LARLTKILVVDDFEPFCRFACSLLQQTAVFEVSEAADGLDAVQKIKELNPDLILLDIGLPRLNGIEVARRVHSLAPAAKVLFCSQDSSPELVREALTLGLAYIHKPDAWTDLLPALEAVLSGRQFVSSKLGLDQAIGARAPRHEILFCSDDTAILDGLTRFIAAALKGGNAGIVWATESHRNSLRQSLVQRGVDVEAAILQGTYIAADVSEPPDAARVVASINSLKEGAAKMGNKHPRVAVCGERAGLLWAEGRTDLAIRLEQTLNQLAKSYEIDILCTYPSPTGQQEQDDEAVRAICAEHSTISFG
jgi:DNA-binding NarL/FixJ family response regulator